MAQTSQLHVGVMTSRPSTAAESLPGGPGAAPGEMSSPRRGFLPPSAGPGEDARSVDDKKASPSEKRIRSVTIIIIIMGRMDDSTSPTSPYRGPGAWYV
ncbi:unnamed protein product [Diplocarpon coronariae]